MSSPLPGIHLWIQPACQSHAVCPGSGSHGTGSCGQAVEKGTRGPRGDGDSSWQALDLQIRSLLEAGTGKELALICRCLAQGRAGCWPGSESIKGSSQAWARCDPWRGGDGEVPSRGAGRQLEKRWVQPTTSSTFSLPLALHVHMDQAPGCSVASCLCPGSIRRPA